MTQRQAAARRGLFLDLDGTLADTLPALRKAYHAFLARFGAAGSAREFESLNGPPIPEIVGRLVAAHRIAGDRDALVALYRGLLEAEHGAAAPIEGARDLLAAAAARGWIVAVVTSNPRAATLAWLARAGLAGRVAAVVGGDEGTRAKPDPAPYRLALARTGCDAAASRAIEDGVQGALAALGAGLATWRLGGTSAPELAAHPLFRGVLPDLRAALSLL